MRIRWKQPLLLHFEILASGRIVELSIWIALDDPAIENLPTANRREEIEIHDENAGFRHAMRLLRSLFGSRHNRLFRSVDVQSR
jgi:hypothetical protein